MISSMQGVHSHTPTFTVPSGFVKKHVAHLRGGAAAYLFGVDVA